MPLGSNSQNSFSWTKCLVNAIKPHNYARLGRCGTPPCLAEDRTPLCQPFFWLCMVWQWVPTSAGRCEELSSLRQQWCKVPKPHEIQGPCILTETARVGSSPGQLMRWLWVSRLGEIFSELIWSWFRCSTQWWRPIWGGTMGRNACVY